jgi:hypothetical protein
VWVLGTIKIIKGIKLKLTNFNLDDLYFIDFLRARPDEIVSKDKIRPFSFVRTLDLKEFAIKKVTISCSFNLSSEYEGPKGRW